MCNSPRRRCALIAVWLTLVTPPGIAIDIQGHRGARGLAPENTLPAFRRALTEGVSTLELDVGMTRGGVVVIHHDASLNPMLTRGRDGRWIDAPILLSGLSLARLRRFDVGRVRPDTEYAARFALSQSCRQKHFDSYYNHLSQEHPVALNFGAQQN